MGVANLRWLRRHSLISSNISPCRATSSSTIAPTLASPSTSNTNHPKKQRSVHESGYRRLIHPSSLYHFNRELRGGAAQIYGRQLVDTLVHGGGIWPLPNNSCKTAKTGTVLIWIYAAGPNSWRGSQTYVGCQAHFAHRCVVVFS